MKLRKKIKNVILSLFNNTLRKVTLWRKQQKIIDFFNNKAKTYYQSNKDKIQKRLQRYNRNLSKDEKILKKKLC